MLENIPSDELKASLQSIAKLISLEDVSVRQRQIRQWKQLKYYWDGITNIWWSDVAHDWQIFGNQNYNGEYGDAAYYDKKINVLKAYCETVIAALSVTIPTIKCAPDDADNPLDCSTAKAGDKIAALVRKHVNAELLWLKALFIYCTEGLVFYYNYPKEDFEYGTYKEDKYKDFEEQAYLCPECGSNVDDLFIGREQNEFDPGSEDAELHSLLQEDKICPQCASLIDPSLQKSPYIVQRIVGSTDKPKSRICIEVLGGLFIKVPNYVSNLKESPYLEYSYETNYVNIRERYEHLRDKDFKFLRNTPGTDRDPYDRWGRLSTQYLGEYPANTVTVRNLWLRPSAYHYLNDTDKVDELKKKYPDGCKFIIIEDEVVEAFNESLDDHWTSMRNPLSDYLHYQPLAMLLTSVQDISNEFISLGLQTLEHGIAQTFVDPGVVNLDEYRQSEVLVGGVYPATPKAGKSVSDAFYDTTTATFPAEMLPFGQEIQQLGQFSSGAMPSLFGGALPNSSKTASQYLSSKNQSQQRLQNTWKMFCVAWKELFSKVVPMYIKEAVDDEKFVTKDANGNFINSFIRKAELQGKIGDIELEAAENLPISWMQKKDTIMQFLQAASPEIMQALIDPQNLPIIAASVGLEDMSLPGENDRQVQLEEIIGLINSVPIPDFKLNPMTMQPEEIENPSIPIEPDVDNHEIHIQLCRNWLTSEPGRLAKLENQDGYKNVLLHMKQHIEFIQMQQMKQMMQQNSQSNTGKPGNDKVAAPNKDQMHEESV